MNHGARSGCSARGLFYASASWQADALCYQPLRPSVRPSVRYQTCEHNILEVNEPILMQTDVSGLRRKGMKQSSLGVRRSKVEIT